jgi:hypothetical protein
MNRPKVLQFKQLDCGRLGRFLKNSLPSYIIYSCLKTLSKMRGNLQKILGTRLFIK